jgi:hypothetical protein
MAGSSMGGGAERGGREEVHSGICVRRGCGAAARARGGSGVKLGRAAWQKSDSIITNDKSKRAVAIGLAANERLPAARAGYRYSWSPPKPDQIIQRHGHHLRTLGMLLQ